MTSVSCRSHYTDTDPTCRERAATAGIEPGTSSPGVARSTAELPRPLGEEERGLNLYIGEIERMSQKEKEREKERESW